MSHASGSMSSTGKALKMTISMNAGFRFAGETVSPTFPVIERIKKEFEVGSMPGPWRSAKSVIHSAMKLGIGLVDDTGGFYGKTFLQNKIKDSKTDTKEPETNEEYGNRVIKMLMSVPEGIDAVAVVKQVKDFLKVVD